MQMQKPSPITPKIGDNLIRMAVLLVGAAALVWLMQSGKQILLPSAFALVIGVVCAPLADRIDRVGAPRVICALAVMLVVLGTLLGGALIFYPVISEFASRMPLMWNELQEALGGLKSTMESVEDVQKEVAKTLSSTETPDTTPTPAVELPTLGVLIGYVPAIGAQMMVFVGILYFFLLTRVDLYKFVEKRFRALTDTSLFKAESQVSRYFLTVSTINACFGVLVAMMLTGLGMPNAIYWGLAAFFVNFVLYLGPISFAATLMIAGLIVFDGPISVAPSLLYMSMNMVEGQFVTPSLVGRHMSVNPLLVFISLVFFLWLWGPLGGVIAIPILVWARQVNKALLRNDPSPEAAAIARLHKA